MMTASTLMRQRELPWFNSATTVVDGLQTTEEALTAAGLNWDVQLKANTHNIYQGGKTIRQKSRAISVVRTDNWREIGVVGSKYQTLSNADSFQFLTNLAGESGALFHAAGSLNDGSQVFIIMKFPETIRILDREEFDQYVLFLTSHDGSLAVTATPTTVRPECTNMFRTLISLGKAEARVWRAQHLSNLTDKMRDLVAVEKSMQVVQNGAAHFQRLAKRLAAMPIGSDGDFYELMDLAMPWSGKPREKLVKGIRDLWNTSDTIPDDLRRTAWGVLNATTEHVDHVRDYRTNDSRFNYIMFTQGAVIERNLTRGLNRRAPIAA